MSTLILHTVIDVITYPIQLIYVLKGTPDNRLATCVDQVCHLVDNNGVLFLYQAQKSLQSISRVSISK